jgi:hypothetical protein
MPGLTTQRGGGLTRRPSAHSVPAGATDADAELDGMERADHWPAPWFVPPAQSGLSASVAPLDQARPSRSATNFVASPDFTRMRTERLPSF